jgi:hypothetical protein
LWLSTNVLPPRCTDGSRQTKLSKLLLLLLVVVVVLEHMLLRLPAVGAGIPHRNSTSFTPLLLLLLLLLVWVGPTPLATADAGIPRRNGTPCCRPDSP